MKNLILPCSEKKHIMQKFPGHVKLQVNKLIIF